MVEGICGRWCPRYWKQFPVPCTGTIGVQSWKFEKSEKIDFFQMIFKIFFLDLLDIIGVQ